MTLIQISIFVNVLILSTDIPSSNTLTSAP